MPLFRRSQNRNFTAAATPFKVKDPLAALLIAQTRQTWQTLAYAYYSTVGELHYSARFVGNSMSRMKLCAATKPETDEDDPEIVESGPVFDAVRALRSPRGGQAGLVRAMAMNLFIAGETYLVGTEGGDGRQQWDACSINELIFMGTDAYRRQAPALPPLLIDSNALVIRVWNEHPEFSLLADSSLRSCMDECEKLLLLSRADKAVARSRFAGSGILFMPAEIMPPATRNAQDPERENPFMQKLTEAMMSSLIDETDTSSVVPLLVVGPADYGDKIKYITFDRPLNARSAALKQESIVRIATALDLPPEVLTGKAGMNDWSAFAINEDTVRSHLMPGIELICDALTEGYLQPALKQAGVDDWDNYIVWYDAANLTQNPDRSDKAQAVYDRGGLSLEALRRENGFSEEDKPSDKEYKMWVGVQLKDEAAATGGTPETPGALQADQQDHEINLQKMSQSHEQALAKTNADAQVKAAAAAPPPVPGAPPPGAPPAPGATPTAPATPGAKAVGVKSTPKAPGTKPVAATEKAPAKAQAARKKTPPGKA